MSEASGELREVADRLRAATRVLVTCHLGPDGDAAGSMCALAALLESQGRGATLYNPDRLPRTLRFLPRAAAWVRQLPADARFDLTVVVDCGDRRLLGDHFPPPEVTGPLLVLDHHSSSRPFGDVYVCDPSAASVGVLVARLADVLGWPIPSDAAVAIYTSIVSDTGSFRYANTNAEALALAARLVDRHGVSPWAVAEELGERHSLSRYRLLSAALSSLTLELSGRVAVMVVTEEMLRATGATWEETEGLVSYARALDGVECGVLLSPAREGGVRVSLRSKGHRIDAGAVLKPLGGGGHVGAAGCRMDGTIEMARVRVLEALAAAFQ